MKHIFAFKNPIDKIRQKSSLTLFDGKRISDFQRADLKMREDFESQIDVYIKTDDSGFTYALLYPQWPKYSGGKYWNLVYYSIKGNSERKETHDFCFCKYRDFNKLLRKS